MHARLIGHDGGNTTQAALRLDPHSAIVYCALPCIQPAIQLNLFCTLMAPQGSVGSRTWEYILDRPASQDIHTIIGTDLDFQTKQHPGVRYTTQKGKFTAHTKFF